MSGSISSAGRIGERARDGMEMERMDGGEDLGRFPREYEVPLHKVTGRSWDERASQTLWPGTSMREGKREARGVRWEKK